MRGVIIRFLNLEVLNAGPVVDWALLLAWGILLAAALMSVRSQSFSLTIKGIWLLMILCLPLAGLAVYCSWCLAKADWSFLKPLLQTRSQAIKSVSQAR